jgi:hypothetical protein
MELLSPSPLFPFSVRRVSVPVAEDRGDKPHGSLLCLFVAIQGVPASLEA